MLQRARTLGAEVLVPSPCMSICRIDAVRATCEGCFLTLDEIAVWSRLDDASKRDVWHAIAQRAGAVA